MESASVFAFDPARGLADVVQQGGEPDGERVGVTCRFIQCGKAMVVDVHRMHAALGDCDAADELRQDMVQKPGCAHQLDSS